MQVNGPGVSTSQPMVSPWSLVCVCISGGYLPTAYELGGTVVSTGNVLKALVISLHHAEMEDVCGKV